MKRIGTKKLRVLRACNFCLMAVGVLTLVSSIQMEVCEGKGALGLSFDNWMYLHCVLGTGMFALVIAHMYLHFGKCNWLAKIKKLRMQTRWLCIVFAILLAFSVVVFIRTVVFTSHSLIGAVHGKIGFLFLLFCIGHTAKRWKWFRAATIDSFH